MSVPQSRDRFLGTLFGLAIGDALGAPVEFLSTQQIQDRYGPNGTTDLDGWGGFPAGTYTDDTQMSLATAEGCLLAAQRWPDQVVLHSASTVHQQYLAWLKTQNEPAERRAPGRTCISALQSGEGGSVTDRINNSKGCGGVMRTAPAGLAFPPGEAFKQGAEFAALTHGHPSGYLSAGFLSELIRQILEAKNLAPAVEAARDQLVRYDDHAETLSAVEDASMLAASDKPVLEAIPKLGLGWVGEEALAIALFCALRFPKDWVSGTLAAVNHSGDADSTGSICGAILGAHLGVQAIPLRWCERIENRDGLEEIAIAMHQVFVEG